MNLLLLLLALPVLLYTGVLVLTLLFYIIEVFYQFCTSPFNYKNKEQI